MKSLSLAFRHGWASRLRQAMEAKGMMPAKLAQACETSESIVYRWLGGQVAELEKVDRIAEILDVQPGWLVFGREEDHGGPLARRKNPRQGVPIRGGSDARLPQAGGVNDDKFPLIGRWLRDWWDRVRPAYQPWDLTAPAPAC